MFERYAPNPPQMRPTERTALRAFGWSELTTRINAARELRRLLRNDALVEASSFADAAGGYFVSEGMSKQTVNQSKSELAKCLSDKQTMQQDADYLDDQES